MKLFFRRSVSRYLANYAPVARSAAYSRPAGERDMKRGNRRIFTATAAVLSLSLMTAACSATKSTPSPGRAATRTSLTIGQTAALTDNFDPYNLAPSNFVMMYQVYTTLVRESASLKPEPSLARSWQLAQNGLSLTLHLRSAKFSNDAPITSQTVAYDIQLVKQKASAANIRVLAKNITSVEATSPNIVVLNFVKPFPGVFDFLNLLFITNQSTVASHYANVDASGPFKVASYNPGVGFTLVRNPYYWGIAPKVAMVNVKFLSNEQTLIDSLRTGTVDLADLVSPFDAKSLTGNKSFVTGIPPAGNSIFTFIFNVTSSPLNNVDVRDALSMALDRQKIISIALSGEATPACIPFVSTASLGYNKQLATSCKFNLAAAKAKLRQSGLPASALQFTMVTSTQANPVLTQMSEIFQADLAKIGVTMHIQDVNSAAWNSDAISGSFQSIASLYGRANLDPSTLFGADTLWYPSGNNAHFVNPEYASLINQADTMYNTAKRRALYAQIDKIILQQNFALPVATNPRPYAEAADVHGVVWTVNGAPVFAGATVG